MTDQREDIKPFAWCFTDVNGRPTQFCDDPKHASEGDLRTRTPLYAQPQSAVPEWIKCSDRMPTSEDGYVWLYWEDGSGEVGENVWQWDYCDVKEGDTHWMPANLKRPAKPQQEQES